MVPRARGGQHLWTNVVAACSRCNHRKGSKLLAEIGWSLGFTPGPPPATVALLVGVGARHPSWEPYLVSAPPAVAG